MKAHKMDEKRIQHAISKGEEAFWAAVANEFPEATTGDLSPELVVEMNRILGRVVRAWVDANIEEASLEAKD